MQFLEWNDRLASYFFNEEMDGREVLLNVNKRIIEEEIGLNSFSLNSFIESVKKGPPWVTRDGLCMKAYQAFDNWRSRNLEFPPYLAFLVLFVLANDVEGDFDSKAYYPRLRQLIGEDPEPRPLPSFEKMFDLWCDLEIWSKEDKKEELGRFTPWWRGGYIHVGLPLSQTILTREERNRLPLFLDEAGFEPGMSVSSDILDNVLKKFGNDYFSARTMKLLTKSNAEYVELKRALIQLVQEELLIWDGTLPNTSETHDSPAKKRSGLRICLEVEQLSGNIKGYLRLKFNRAIPEAGFYFIKKNHPDLLFHCLESTQRWSTPLIDLRDNKRLDAFAIDWSENFEIIDTTQEWKAKLKETNIRLFTKGKDEGLPSNHWIESTQVLQRGSEFIITCTKEYKELIENWIRNDCEEVNGNEQKFLPNGWLLFHARNARKSCKEVDILTFSPDLNLRLRGGFKLGRGNRYFNFGLPEVILENAFNENIRIIGKEYQRDLALQSGSENIWIIPQDIPPGQTYKFEVLDGGTNVHLKRNYAITVTTDTELITSHKIEPVKRSSTGELLTSSDSGNFISGARVVSDEIDQSMGYGFLPLYLSSKIILLGRKPGEICEFPEEPIPDEWDPVWLLAKKNRDDWIVCFCGKNLSVIPTIERKVANIALQKKWKESIWVKRRHQDLSLLKLKSLQQLWRKYKRVAENI
jgi:hypothetical protein